MLKTIHNRGNPEAPIWVVVEAPYTKDSEKGFLFSSGLGYIFIKMMNEAGIKDFYICSRKPCLEEPHSYTIIENAINFYKPPIILALGNTASFFCEEVRKDALKKHKSPKQLIGFEEVEETSIDKFAGSLLRSRLLSYPHYVIPTYNPDFVVANWDVRDIVISFDLGKAKSELDWIQKHGVLQPLPERRLLYDLSFPEIIAYLDFFQSSHWLSVDIETIYPSKKNYFFPHPGNTTCVGIASDVNLGISFSLFRDSPEENILLWRKLDSLLKTKKIIGQNFFNFDWYRFQMYGFDIPLENISDTLIRHQLLYPEMSHKLQFLTRQYTREPFYKEEAQGWSVKDMLGLRKYNCKDVCVTAEVWLKEEEELIARGII